MSQKSISSVNLDEAITTDDILGKDVIDAEGRFIGIAEKVFIDAKSLDFIGIGVDKGFLKKGLSIGKDYIERIASHAVFLRIRVAFELKGMSVFDKNGKLVGVVSDVVLVGRTNKIQSMKVTTGMTPTIVGKVIDLPHHVIETIGYNIILTLTKEEALQGYAAKKDSKSGEK